MENIDNSKWRGEKRRKWKGGLDWMKDIDNLRLEIKQKYCWNKKTNGKSLCEKKNTNNSTHSTFSWKFFSPNASPIIKMNSHDDTKKKQTSLCYFLGVCFSPYGKSMTKHKIWYSNYDNSQKQAPFWLRQQQKSI